MQKTFLEITTKTLKIQYKLGQTQLKPQIITLYLSNMDEIFIKDLQYVCPNSIDRIKHRNFNEGR